MSLPTRCRVLVTAEGDEIWEHHPKCHFDGGYQACDIDESLEDDGCMD